MFARHPTLILTSEELEWFADDRERVLGVVTRHREDQDYMFAVLGRDENRRFRCIDVCTECYATSGRARSALITAMERNARLSDETYWQGDEGPPGVDLFEPVVPEEKMHPAFRAVAKSEHFSPARELLSELMHHWRDVDGNFVQQLQTTGFDSRIWELYLHAMLVEQFLLVERPQPSPDFFAHRGPYGGFFLEAVTVGTDPSGEQRPSLIDPKTLRPMKSPEEIRAILSHEMPIRYGSPLYSKLKKAYWERPEVAGHPLVFAIADFHEPFAMTWSGTALFEYLYGVRHDFSFTDDGKLHVSAMKIETHKRGQKEVPSGYFFQPEAENVSAVLFSATGTISKFNRMGKLASYGSPRVTLHRVGTCQDHNPDASMPRKFAFEVAAGQIKETWIEGVSVFHNPNSKAPLDPDFLPGAGHHFLRNGQIESVVPDFHPFSSVTLNTIIGK